MAATTWHNPALWGTWTFSNGNLTGLHDGTNTPGFLLATNLYSSGNFYWECHVDVAQDANAAQSYGIANASYTPNNSSTLGDTANSCGWNGGTGPGAVTINGSTIATVYGYGQGDIPQFAWKSASKLLWLNKNNSTGTGTPGSGSGGWNNNNGNPATGVGGISLSTLNSGPWGPCVELYRLNDQVTGRFASTSWSFAAPSGFISLDPVLFTPAALMHNKNHGRSHNG